MPTSFICHKARLATRDIGFMCLHSIYMTMVVTTSEIIAVTNRKMPIVGLLKKKFFLHNSKSLICLSCKSKISFLYRNWRTKSFSVFGAFSNSELN